LTSIRLRLASLVDWLIIFLQVSNASSASCELLLKIMTTSRSPVVGSAARNMCTVLVGRAALFGRTQSEIGQCLKHEICSWVDCMTSENIEDFCTILNRAKQQPFHGDIFLFRAWQACGLPKPTHKLPASPILVTALEFLSEGKCSPTMAASVNQVTTKCLLFHDDPLPLSVLVQSFFETAQKQTKKVAGEKSPGGFNPAIVEYTESLVDFSAFDETSRMTLLGAVVNACFTKSSLHHRIMKVIQDNSTHDCLLLLQGASREEAVAATRFIIHIVACAGSKATRQRCISLLKSLLPAAMEVRPAFFADDSI